MGFFVQPNIFMFPHDPNPTLQAAVETIMASAARGLCKVPDATHPQPI